jgi:hypothetical protein
MPPSDTVGRDFAYYGFTVSFEGLVKALMRVFRGTKPDHFRLAIKIFWNTAFHIFTSALLVDLLRQR